MFSVRKRAGPGFTITELLVVVLIITLVAGLILSAFQKVREAAARAQCSNNLKQIALSAVNAADANSGNLPPGLGLYPNRNGATNNGSGGLFFHILPFLESNPAYNSTLTYKGDPGDDGRNAGFYPYYSAWSLQQLKVRSYLCPADPTIGGWAQAATSYAYNGMVFKLAFPSEDDKGYSRYPGDIPDGTSNTIFFMDKEMQVYGNTSWVPDGGFAFWPDWGPCLYSEEGGQPTGLGALWQPTPRLGCGTRLGACADGNLPASPHPGGIMVGMGDGSVRFIGPEVTARTWWDAITPAGGPPGLDW